MKTKTVGQMKRMKKQSVKELIQEVRERYRKITFYLMERVLRYKSLDDVPEMYFYYLERVKRHRKKPMFPKELETLHIHPKPLEELDEVKLELFVRHVLRDENEEVIKRVVNNIKSQKRKKTTELDKIMVEDIPKYEKVKLLKSHLMDIGKRSKKRMLKMIFDDEEVQDLLGIDLTVGDKFSRPYLIADMIYDLLAVKVSYKMVFKMLQDKVEIEYPLFNDSTVYWMIRKFVEDHPNAYNGWNGRSRLAKDLLHQGITFNENTLKSKLTEMMRRGELPYTGWS